MSAKALEPRVSCKAGDPNEGVGLTLVSGLANFMKYQLSIAEDFGPRLADGVEASKYRHTRIDPYVAMCEEMTLDFTGVRTANSSFVNAVVAALLEQHGEAVLAKLVFKGCNPVVRVLVEGAIDLGLQKSEERSHA